MPGFELALDLGVNTLELDLHLSADGQVVIWHDPVIDENKCGGTGVDQSVRSLTAAELRSLICDRNPDPGRFVDQTTEAGSLSGNDYGLVTLSELFDFVADYAVSESKTNEQRASAANVRFNIETKRNPDDPSAIGDDFDGETAGQFEQAVIDAVVVADVVARVTVQSFDHRSLWAVAAEEPELKLVALTRRNDRPDLDDIIGNGASIWSPDHRALDQNVVAEAHAAGLQVIPWTVNDPADMAELIEFGVDGIITDRPDLRPAP